jgi:CubicO group peptidase (beta-lactamase class C family)
MKTTELSKAVSQARGILQEEWASKVPGLSVTAVINGKTIWSEAFGHADLEKQIPVTAATRFRIGSVSKPLTAAGLALLVERGLFDLDAPIQNYVPDFPQKDGVITPRLLAGHLSGIRNYGWKEAASNQPFPNLRSGVTVFENDPLVALPGTKYSYTSYNWNLLGVAMEAAAKQDFLSYMEENVLKPLALADTLPDRAGAEDPQRAQGYEVDPTGKFIAAPAVDLSYCWLAGGYLATTTDMARFGSAHWLPDFLKPESLKLLFTSQTTADGKPTHYGVGWFVNKNTVFHGGDSYGGTSMLLLVPAVRLAVAIACNRGYVALANAIRRKLANEDAQRLVINKTETAHKVAAVLVKWVAARVAAKATS